MNLKNIAVLLASIAALALAGCGERNDEHGEHAHEAHADEHGSDEHKEDEHGADEHHAGAEAGHSESEEGGHHDEVKIDAKTAEELGVRVAQVGPGVVRDAHEVQGLLTPIEGKHARVRARYPGPIQAVRAGVGDVVKAGQTLALVESNVSLTSYPVTAPFAGTILDVSAGPGDIAGDEPLFELADLSSLWVDLHLFGGDAQHITRGLEVEITRLSDGARAMTKLDRVLPGTATASQSTVARATIRNSDGQWRPGAAVRARVTVTQREAPIVVPVGALQNFEGNTVVFVRDGEEYTPRIVKIGQRDATSAEVTSGLAGGEDVVVEQSYLIKADLEKGSAAHEH